MSAASEARSANARRQAEYNERMARAELVRTQVWVPKVAKEALRAFAAKLTAAHIKAAIAASRKPMRSHRRRPFAARGEGAAHLDPCHAPPTAAEGRGMNVSAFPKPYLEPRGVLGRAQANELRAAVRLLVRAEIEAAQWREVAAGGIGYEEAIMARKACNLERIRLQALINRFTVEL